VAYKLAVFEILRDFFCISIYYASTLSLHIESTDPMLATLTVGWQEIAIEWE